MRLKYREVEVEGKDTKEIDWLLERVKSLASELKPAAGGIGEGSGRKEKYIKFPRGKFTVQELTDELDGEISGACIYQRLMKMEAAGDAKRVGERREPGQRGRATAEWRVINFPPEEQETTARQPREKFEVDLDAVPD